MNSYTHIYEYPGMYDVIDHYDGCFPELASPTDILLLGVRHAFLMGNVFNVFIIHFFHFFIFFLELG